MPKHCTGAKTNNSFLPKETKAFSEGIYFRAGGDALTRPVTDNPHEPESDAGVAWTAGWQLGQDAAIGIGFLVQSDMPCVAMPTNVIAE